MKLEVGMYIRYIPTQGEYTQKISKITKMENRILDMGYQLDNEKDLVFSCHFDQIINASHKIEDLLKKGDYVNGYMITDFDDDYYDEELDEDVEGFSIVLGNEEQYYRIPPKDIETIVTKEQFEAMRYKVV